MEYSASGVRLAARIFAELQRRVTRKWDEMKEKKEF